MDDSRIKSASTLLSAFFDEEKLKQGGRYAEFFACWNDLVGSRFAAHSRVADVEKGVLIIEAEHPGWIQLLQLRQSEILEGLSKRFPEFGLRSILFRLGGARPNTAQRETRAAAGDSPGPFGPSGRALASESSEKISRQRDEPPPVEPVYPRKIDDIGDPELRVLLSQLKKSIEGGKS